MIRWMLLLAVLACIAGTGPVAADAPTRPPASWQPFDMRSQEPSSLPKLFRQHCQIDATRTRRYCAAECGSGYQFYYCSKTSFGCCHVAAGYCDHNASLRCAP